MNCHLRHLLVLTAFGVLGTLATGDASAAPVQPQFMAKGWVWADQPAAALNTPYAASLSYQYGLRTERLPTSPFRTRSGGTNTVTRTGTGAYRVTFANLAVLGGTAHVTAYGGSHQCKVSSWGSSGADLQLNVLCFAPGGAAVNGRFTALFYKDGTKSSFYANAYLWADQPTTAGCTTPSLAYQFNSRGATNTACRVSTGEYDVTMPHMEPDRFNPTTKGGTVQVTAYGSGSERCKVRYWYESMTNVIARVGCSTAAGVAADSRFTASFMRSPGEPAIEFAEDTQESYYVWANSAPNPAAVYQSDSYGTSSAATLESPATGLAIGTYRAHLPGVKSINSTAIVTAYGGGNTYCNVTSWYSNAAIGGTTVAVGCYDSAGFPVNSQFTLFYNTDRIILF
jgi:hypothetical protein